MKDEHQEDSRKRYESPRLVVYGNISDLTAANTEKNKNDNPSGQHKS
ncbi:MAG TPA: lasso RiPP family leader peptide-containing protein [Candidatus Acidoferrum sp.]|nr:lasso RiPP family leader peptide-containing protein [Candidatus Acidoferrum sp.]